MEKLVSIFINAYNSENFILEAVGSVLNQSYKNIQLVVIDDCSTDKTYELLKTVKDNRLELYKNEVNMGISYTCNRGIDLCRGEYIAHIDSDDVWMVNMLEKQVGFLEQNPKYGACFSQADIIDSSGKLCNDTHSELKEIYNMYNLPQEKMFRYFIENPNRLSHSSVVAKASVVKQIGHHRLSTRYLHDYDYWLRMIMHCEIYILQEALTMIRVHNDSNSTMNESKWIAHDNELLYIIDNAIENCSDELFLRAFNGKLRLSGEYTHKETRLEKAFYSIDNIYRFKTNPILAIKRLMRLFDSDPEYLEISMRKFNFSLKDLYVLQAHRLYSDTELIESQKQLIDHLHKIKASQDDYLEEMEKIISTKNDEYKNLEVKIAQNASTIEALNDAKHNLKNDYEALQKEYVLLSNSYAEIQNSFCWRITAPIRKISKIFKK